MPLSAGANSWTMSSVLMTFLNTVQSFLPNGMETRLPLPSVPLSNITSLRNTRILPASISPTSASDVRSTACMASMASANTDCPYGLISTRVLSTAGLTIEKVAKGHPVS